MHCRAWKILWRALFPIIYHTLVLESVYDLNVMHVDLGECSRCERLRHSLRWFQRCIHAPIFCSPKWLGEDRKWVWWGGTFGLVLCFPEDRCSSSIEQARLIFGTGVLSHGCFPEACVGSELSHYKLTCASPAHQLYLWKLNTSE